MSKELSAEWQQKIEEEAEAYAEKTGDRLTYVKEYYTHSDREAGYIEAATLYASLLIEAQDRVKDLENSMRNIIRASGAADYLGAKRIANEAISPVNPKKKEDE